MSSAAFRLSLFGSVLALAGIGSSCNLDPVHRASVNSLGPEAEELYPPESEFHRPGEPCVLCHSSKGPASSEFVLGGTVFWGPENYENRVDRAYVRIKDARKVPLCFVTNCNGNFFVRPEDFRGMTFPLLVSVERAVEPGRDEKTLVIRRMSGHIGREGSCATCHIQGIRDFGSPGQIRLFDTEQQFRDAKINLPPCPPEEEQFPLACPELRE